MTDQHTHLMAIACAIAGSAALATGCSTMRTRSDYDREASFRSFQTFAWVEPDDSTRQDVQRIDPFLERRLRRAVETQLADRGYVPLTTGNPDFLVSAYAVVERPTAGGRQVGPAPQAHVSVGFGFGSSWGWGRSRGWGRPGWRGYSGFGRYNPYWWGSSWWGPAWYGGWGPWGGWAPFVGMSYTVPVGTRRSGRSWPGTLVVDVYDARTGQLTWRGWAEEALAYAPEPEHMSEFIDETVGKIMRTFPPET